MFDKSARFMFSIGRENVVIMSTIVGVEPSFKNGTSANNENEPL